MSLASRLANIFTPFQATHLAPTDARSSVGVDGNASTISLEHHSLYRKGGDVNMRAMEEEEKEEPRPPYLHV